MSPVPVECIFKLRQGHIVPFYFSTKWLATLVTFLKVVSDFLSVVLNKHETNIDITKGIFNLLR